jgi:hypothetical protein
VDLVNNVDLEGALGRRVLAFLPQVADLVHGIVGSTVNLDHVHATAIHDRLADVRFIRRIDIRPTLRVERLGKDPGGGRLAGPARTDKEIGMGDTARLDGIAQGPDDVVLPHDVLKSLGPPAPCDHLVICHP